MKVYTCDAFELPLTVGHSFPVAKYRMLRERVEAEHLADPLGPLVPLPASDAEILRVHDPAYLDRLVAGTLSANEAREIGLPWSKELVERARRSCGATLSACRSALKEGIGVNLAGGTHHAHKDRGAGYCVFNDAAIAARAMQSEGRASRVLVIDLDVHHGDGTAAIFADDPCVYTFSVHGAKNYPLRKPPSDLDVPVDDGLTDEPYLEAVARGLAQAMSESNPDLAIYLAGADPYEGDRLGRLKISKEGLGARDRHVFATLHQARVPVALTMAGGYGHVLSETVEIQAQTVRIAREFWQRIRDQADGS